jgi:hypothetical protein
MGQRFLSNSSVSGKKEVGDNGREILWQQVIKATQKS